MNIFTLKHHVQGLTGGQKLARWRWKLTFEATLTRRFWLGFFLKEEIQNEENFDTDEWRHANRYVAVYVNTRWKVGSEHLYYDGPHCSWNLGFFHVAWMADRHCRKCEGDE